jgi:hypothetical protein
LLVSEKQITETVHSTQITETVANSDSILKHTAE